MIKLKKIHFHYHILITLSIIFFVVFQYLHQPMVLQNIFSGEPTHLIANQPDEVSNYFFARTLVFEHEFGYREDLSITSLNQVHPRSMTVIYNHLAPIGSPFIIVLLFLFTLVPAFVGGVVWFNVFAVLFVPLLAALTPLVMYGILRRVLNRPYAFVTAILAYILPAWWYYASYTFQHTIPYIFFIVLGLYGLSRLYEGVGDRSTLVSFLSAASFAIAIAIRPFDVVWIVFVALCAVYMLLQQKKSVQYLYVLYGGVVVLIALLLTHYGYYSHPFGTGYIIPNSEGGAGIITSGTANIPFISIFFAPFGFDPLQIAKTIYRYVIFLFSPWFLLACSGFLLIFLKRKQHIGLWIYARIFLGVCALILFYYGSWNSVSDAFTTTASIGSGHVRYLMPLYVGFLPLAGYALYYAYVFFSRKFSFVFSLIFSGVLVITLGLYSGYAVFFSQPNGLFYTKQTLVGYYYERGQILSAVPEDGVIITRFADKFIFPVRKVLMRNADEEWARASKNLILEGVPLYWYDVKISSEEFLDIQTLLDTYGLRLGESVFSLNNSELRRIVEK